MLENKANKSSDCMIDTINEPEHKKEFGMIVRMHRIKQQYTLRSLAERISISHAFLRKIETAQTSISKTIYDYLIKELQIALHYDTHDAMQFKELNDGFYKSILFYDVTKSEAIMDKLKANADHYGTSLWMIDFLIVELGYLNFIRNMDYSRSKRLYRDLISIKDLMNDKQKQLFLVFSGAYFYHVSDIDTALELFNESIETNALSHMHGLTEYLIARCHSTRHHFSKASRHLNIAHAVFKANNNYLRTAYAKLMKDAYELLLNKRDDINEIHEQTKIFTRQYKLKGVQSKVDFLLMLYYYKKDYLDDALNLLQKTKQKNTGYYYYKAMIHLKLGNEDLALKAIETGRNIVKNPITNTLIYKYAYDFIEAYFASDTLQYEKALENFFKEAVRQRFYLESKDAYQYYNDLLTQNRKYKTAYNITSTFTDLALEVRH